MLANIAATATELNDDQRDALAAVRLVATAGAPVSPRLLAAITPMLPNAEFSTPYGMTELLPVTVASAGEIGADDAEAGVCVGLPIDGVDIAICAVHAATKTRPVALSTGTLGEVWVRGAHGSTSYDNLWRQTNHAFVDGWHRTGDVGHVDRTGRLWIEGRLDHLIFAAHGAVAPVEIELQAESVDTVTMAAAVGVGPAGTQQVAVVVTRDTAGSAVVADPALAAEIRAAVSVDVAAVLVAPRLPVDRRHNSKIDRTRVQRWADAVLQGKRPPRL